MVGQPASSQFSQSLQKSYTHLLSEARHSRQAALASRSVLPWAVTTVRDRRICVIRLALVP